MDRWLILEDLFGRGIHRRGVQSVDGPLLVEAEEAQECDVFTGGAPLERAARRLLAQRDRELDRAGLDVRRTRDAVHLMHLQIPGGTARLMVGARCLQQAEPRAPAEVVHTLGIVVADRVPERCDVRRRQHLVSGER